MTRTTDQEPARPAEQARTRCILTLAAFLVLLGVQVVCLARYKTPLFEDDVPFFFRYADNLAQGNGYRFNAGEDPVCGASAPLWPLLIATGELFGLAAEPSVLVISVCFTLAATVLLGLLVHRLRGPIGVLALATLLPTQHFFSTWGTSGMESPLTFLLIASVLTVASGVGRWWLVGVIGGLCLIHKVDLAPLGAALLAGCFVWRRAEAGRALLVAAGIAVAWFGFATWYFGSPLPNSFLTKLGAEYDRVPRTWFTSVAFLVGGGAVRSTLAVLGVLALRKRSFVLAMALTQALVPALGYTLHPPTERFSWYIAAVSPAIGFLAASGTSMLLRASPAASTRHVLLAVIPLVPLGAYLLRAEAPYVKGWHRYLESYQAPMREAGRWVDANTPPEARVLTGWGNVAYYSRRFVYDGTSLNRRPEEGSLMDKYRPEVWVYLRFGELSEFQPIPPYEIVHTIESTGGQGPFFVAVLERRLDPEPPPPKPVKQKPEPSVEALLRRLAESEASGATAPSLEPLRARIRAALADMSEEKRALALKRWPALAELVQEKSTAPKQ